MAGGLTMKLPVFQTFGNALGFAFSNFATCFRLAWLPFTLLFITEQVVGWFFRREFMQHLPTRPEDPRAIFQIFIEQWDRIATIQFSILLLQALVIAAVAVSIHRVILFGDRKEGSLVNFSFGKTEFLYMLMATAYALVILTILSSILVPTVYGLAGGDFQAFFAQFRNFPDNMKQFVGSGQFGVLMFAYIAAWIVAAYFMIRLAVWPPSVVATGALSPSEPWQLMRGNVLRFVGLIILTGIFMWIVMAALLATFMSQGGLEAIKGLQTLEHQNPQEMQENLLNAMHPYLPVIYVFGLMAYVFMTSLGVALISYSYKALKGYDAASPIAA